MFSTQYPLRVPIACNITCTCTIHPFTDSGELNNKHLHHQRSSLKFYARGGNLFNSEHIPTRAHCRITRYANCIVTMIMMMMTTMNDTTSQLSPKSPPIRPVPFSYDWRERKEEITGRLFDYPDSATKCGLARKCITCDCECISRGLAEYSPRFSSLFDPPNIHDSLSL